MTANDRSITLTRTYARPPADVFEVWVDPESLRHWYAPVEGWVVGSAEVSPGVGGSYTVTFGPPPEGDAYREHGTYTAFDAPHHLAWTGTLEGEGDLTLRTEVTFAAHGEGTLVTLTEQELPDDATAEEHTEGWTTALKHLAKLLDTAAHGRAAE
ncbi:SRPBCC domain-containing protein [Microbacterium sp. cx-59]|uniref:SRPBCC family protein n=1 Tax=Microbacterium sp. cx-59 TaxID=2891207 RepID=UPI001E3A8240|nr:SRPBCC domain-containing protein [Microbacterium sp. cx-59]MCC4909548.1 SRPBCC domain-containing protein [Microbacterium sp. cx-59]